MYRKNGGYSLIKYTRTSMRTRVSFYASFDDVPIPCSNGILHPGAIVFFSNIPIPIPSSTIVVISDVISNVRRWVGGGGRPVFEME